MESVAELVDAGGRAPPTHPRDEELDEAGEEAEDVEIADGAPHDPRMQHLDGDGNQALAEATLALCRVVLKEKTLLRLAAFFFLLLRMKIRV